MSPSVFELSGSCLHSLRSAASAVSTPDQYDKITKTQVSDELNRLSLWIGNIGAFRQPSHALSVESRLREADDILSHVLGLLEDLDEAARGLSHFISGGEDDGSGIPSEDEELLEDGKPVDEVAECITRLFRVSKLIREATPTDRFAEIT